MGWSITGDTSDEASASWKGERRLNTSPLNSAAAATSKRQGNGTKVGRRVS